MRQRVRALGAAGSVASLILAGCGGNVILDGSGSGVGGSGGAGGSTASTTTTDTTTTFPNTTSSGTTTTFTTTTSSGTTTTFTTTTTPTGPSGCDNTGNCGDIGIGCIGCALEGPCADGYDACMNDMDCTAVIDCFSGCDGGDQACFQTCIDQHPSGFQLYETFVLCVICDACPNDCDGSGSGCP